MDQGIDELIEWLLTKIAFSGLDGLSVKDFVNAVKSFYTDQNGANPDPESSAAVNAEKANIEAVDVSNASIVWKWMVKRKDVIVFPEHLGDLSLEEILLPPQEPSSIPSASMPRRENTKRESLTSSGSDVRLTLSEERQWKAIAGHGPDLKRIPLFEWRALVAIASIGEKGILQGDLVRLTGQDKRSLPMRTDALARKGYIIKQKAVLRGCKTSKLWLTQFANDAKADVIRQGLPEEVLTTPLEEITKNWDPVTFTHYYLENPGPIDYFAISQTFLMIVKAYGAMRYCDIRQKMDINNRTAQMRGLAKSSRWWARAGVVRFEPMKSGSKGKLFKDCVKFVRDPTKEEWAKYRSTPKANLKVPSSRVRNQKKATPSKSESTTVAAQQPRRLGPKPLLNPVTPRIPASPSLIRLSSWNPSKPLASTFIEMIQRSGSQGSSNTELGMFNLGWPYRKYISTLTTMISLPRNLPPHLQPFAIHSTFLRLGKTMTYKFHANDVVTGHTAESLPTSEPKKQGNRDSDEIGTSIQHIIPKSYKFPTPNPGQFLKPGTQVKSYLPITGLGREVYRAGTKRRHDVEEETAPVCAKRTKLVPFTTSVSLQIEEKEHSPLLPGVYYGVRNSLDPNKSKGRPKNSIVMKFVSPALKEPNFFSRPRLSLEDVPEEISVVESPGDHRGNAQLTRVDTGTAPTETSSTPRRPQKRGRAGGSKFKCDKCGSSYKNINGLEYHQKKSLTACNPDWVSTPPKPLIRFSTPKKQETIVARVSDNATSDSPQEAPSTLKRTLPSRRPKLLATEQRLTSEVINRSLANVAHPVKLHNVLEIPTTTASGRNFSVSLTVMQRLADKRSNLSNEPFSSTQSSERTSGNTYASKKKQSTVATTPEIPGTGPVLITRTRTDDGGLLQRPDPGVEPSAQGHVRVPLNDTESVSLVPSPGRPEESSKDASDISTRVPRETYSAPVPVNPVQQAQKIYGRQKISALRRQCTIDIVMRLLEQNEDVLPGDVSIYCLVASKWSETITDTSIAIPERKMFFQILKNMEKDRTISTQHFGRIAQGKMKDISVIYKGYHGNSGNPMPESLDQKIHAVKDKCDELYPNPYIPSQLSLSDKEANICRDTATKYCGADAPKGKTRGRSSLGAKEIPTLGYEMPDERPNNAVTKKDHPDPDGLDSQPDSSRRKRRKLRSDRDELGQPKSERHTTGARGRTAMLENNPSYRYERATNIDHDPRWDIEIAPPGMVKAIEASSSIHFIAPATVAMYERDATLTGGISEDEEDDDDVSLVDVFEDLDNERGVGNGFDFAPVQTITAFADGVWPGQFPRAFFLNRPGGSFEMAGRFPESRWFLRQNLPQDVRDMVDSIQFRTGQNRRTAPRYNKFDFDVEAIEAWERSPEGAYLQNLGNIAPDYIYISLRLESAPDNMKPLKAEWSLDSQYTIDNIPGAIRDARSEEDVPSPQAEEATVREMPRRHIRGTGGRRRPFVKRSDGNWKHRTLLPVIKRETGRWNKEKAVGANIGREKETELVVAIVVIRKLLGGVDKITDWGMFLKLYPEWSISGIRKFWIRVTKERASFIEALSNKFHVSFLEAYKKGEVATLDYEDLENYDWRVLIEWALKLETHHGIELPTTRKQFDIEYTLASQKTDEEDWRESWFHFQTSTYDRLDAASSLAMVLPVTKPSVSDKITELDLQLARSWVRALCNNKVQSTVGAEVRGRLLKLGNRDKSSLNELLERAVAQLLDTKVISKIFGKGFGQVFKLNNHYELRLKKFTHIDKYTQAIEFKAKLDEEFRNNQHVSIPINSEDGSIMAMINLQAYGRIKLEDINFPHVPFGFEPGNYEGRKYSKRYYLFDVKVVPTDTYVYNEDLPIITATQHVPIPKKGPLGEIPIWCDFFGNLERTRWVHYVCMIAFAISVKGPMAIASSVDLLHPVVEEFEARLIMDWLDAVGLLEKASTGHGATVGEWWWLVVGKMIDGKGKSVEV